MYVLLLLLILPLLLIIIILLILILFILFLLPFLPQAIEARSVDQEKASHVNPLTLCFRDSDKERQYQEDRDIGFPTSLACSLLLTLLLGGLQALVLPTTTILLLLFLTAFIWIAVILMLLLAVRLRCIIWDLSRSFLLRLAITIFSIILIYTMAQVATSELVFKNDTTPN